jgi:hypothetical protein
MDSNQDEQTNNQIYEAVVRAYKGQPRNVAKVMALMFCGRLRARLQYDKPVIFMRHDINRPYEAVHIIQLKNVLSSELPKQFYSVAYDVFNKAFGYDKQLVAPRHLDVAIALVKIADMICAKASFKHAVAKEVIEIVLEN